MYIDSFPLTSYPFQATLIYIESGVLCFPFDKTLTGWGWYNMGKSSKEETPLWGY